MGAATTTSDTISESIANSLIETIRSSTINCKAS